MHPEATRASIGGDNVTTSNVASNGCGVLPEQNQGATAITTSPTGEWRKCLSMYLAELMRLEGAGYYTKDWRCMNCRVQFSSEVRMFRCVRCNVLAQCRSCCLTRHQNLPLHSTEEWNLQFWSKISLRELGLVYQLGHKGGPCPTPSASTQIIIVIDISGIHSVAVKYCNCKAQCGSTPAQQFLRNQWFPGTPILHFACATFQVLDLFRLLNLIGNIRPEGFIDSLRQLTSGPSVQDTSGVDLSLCFSFMASYYALLLRLKETGFGQNIPRADRSPTGSSAVNIRPPPESSAVVCWACPQEGKNVPKHWKPTDPRQMYLYTTFLSMGSTFTAGTKATEQPGLSSSLVHGNAYVFEGQPRQKKSSACALPQSCEISSTNVTGVAGCVCARHKLVRPHGLMISAGGSRFPEMDQVFASAVQGIRLPITLLYDLGQQWNVHLPSRALELPPNLRLDPGISLTVLPPTMNSSDPAKGQDSACIPENQPGVGRTADGAIEMLWNYLKTTSDITEDMTKGAVMDFFEAKIDHHNRCMNMGMGETLQRRLSNALKEYRKYADHFRTIDQGVHPEVRAIWIAEAEAWVKGETMKDPHLSYYGLVKKVRTVSRVAVLDSMIQEMQDREMFPDKPPAVSALGFILMGLEIQSSQRKLLRNREKMDHETLQSQREALSTAILNFRFWQDLYMPDESTDIPTDDLLPEVPPEDVKLWLPSDFLYELEISGPELGQIELKLRSVQCQMTMIQIHRCKQIFKSTGNPRVKALLKSAQQNYLDVRFAYICLSGDRNRYPEREDAIDANLCEEEFYSAAFQTTLFRLVIDCMGNREDPYTDGLLDYIRKQWMRAKDIRDRWCEEVELIKEEQKRVLCSLGYQIRWWIEQKPPKHDPCIVDETASGQDAFAARQVAFYRSLYQRFAAMWGMISPDSKRTSQNP